MPRVVWRRRARDDLKRLHEFLLAKDRDASARAAKAILAGVRALRATPRMGRPMEDRSGRREWLIPFGAAGYVVRYGIAPEGTIVILRVWHTRELVH